MARKKFCSRGPNIGKAIGEAQTQTNRTQVVGVPGLDAFEIYLKYHPDYPHDEKYWSEVTMRGNTPKQRISSATGNWEVSYDNGEEWIDLGVKAQGPTFTYEDLTDAEMLDLVAKVNVNAQRIPAVAPGALPAGPDGQSRYMEVTAVGTWTYGGSPVGSNADGYRTTFWWTGDTWVDNGSVKVVGDPAPADGSVAEGDDRAVSGDEVYKVTKDSYDLFSRTNINIVDPSKTSNGYLQQGVFSTNANYKTSDFIPVTAGDIVRGSGLNWATYDINKNIVAFNEVFNFDTVVIPEGSYYFRGDQHSYITDWMLVLNIPLPSQFVPYGTVELDFNEDSPSGTALVEGISKIGVKDDRIVEEHINIFDFNAPRTPGYLDETGAIVNNSAASVSDFMPITPNADYRSSAQLWGVGVYDKDKKFLELITASYSFTITNSNARYVRLSMVNASTTANTMVARSAIYPPYFVPYNKPQLTLNSKDPFQYSWLTSKNRGLIWLTLGDSICNAVEYGYRYQTRMILDLVNINHAFDGATIAPTPNSTRVISEYVDTITDDADIITVHAMVNDVSGGVPLGTFSDTTNATFYGAYRMLAEKLLNKFTGKKIAFMTAIQRVGNTHLKPYVNAIIEVGAHYGIPVLNLNAVCGLYPDLPSYMQYYDDIGLHPNLEGHKIITPKVVNFLNGL